LRDDAKRIRAAAHAADPDAGRKLAQRYKDLGPGAWPQPGAVVAGYAPIRNEIDPWPVLRAMKAAGARLAMPRVEGPDLVFHGIETAADLAPGTFGVPEPAVDRPTVRPDLILVPCLAFDAKGHRLGYGKGFYDRALAALQGAKRTQAVLLAFEAQCRADLPAEAHDIPLDAVATETGARWFARHEGKENE
jgi:5-formyltetrahydrofolate cyclo-ligase